MNKGAHKLVKKFPKRGDQLTVAAAVGVNSSLVSRWMRGLRCPNATHRFKLQKLFQIKWELWDQEHIEAG